MSVQKQRELGSHEGVRQHHGHLPLEGRAARGALGEVWGEAFSFDGFFPFAAFASFAFSFASVFCRQKFWIVEAASTCAKTQSAQLVHPFGRCSELQMSCMRSAKNLQIACNCACYFWCHKTNAACHCWVHSRIETPATNTKNALLRNGIVAMYATEPQHV